MDSTTTTTATPNAIANATVSRHNWKHEFQGKQLIAQFTAHTFVVLSPAFITHTETNNAATSLSSPSFSPIPRPSPD
jgi:hypothetical protein